MPTNFLITIFILTPYLTFFSYALSPFRILKLLKIKIVIITNRIKTHLHIK